MLFKREKLCLQEGIPEDVEVFYVGSLPTELGIAEQEVSSAKPLLPWAGCADVIKDASCLSVYVQQQSCLEGPAKRVHMLHAAPRTSVTEASSRSSAQ